MKDSFDHDFYIAIGTVVPLLYITLILQGSSIQGFAKRIGLAWDKSTIPLADAIFNHWLKGNFRIYHIWVLIRFVLFLLFVAIPVLLTTMATVVGSPFAVGYSFWALFYQSDVSYIRAIVLASALGLLMVVCSNPTAVVLRNLFASYVEEDENSGPAGPGVPSTASPSAPPSPSVADELTKLAELRDAGTLTDAEFAAQKAKLLRTV